jgi:hypothetical protein
VGGFTVHDTKRQDVVDAVNKYIKNLRHRVMEVYNLQLEMGVQLENLP